MRKPKEDSVTIVLLIIIILLTISFAYSTVFKHAPVHSAPITRPETISVKPEPESQVVPISDTPIIPKPPVGWKLYSNASYGFSFMYPDTWTLRENSSNKQVTVTSDINSDQQTAGSGNIPLEVIGFQATNKNFFTPHVETKYGEIAYDEARKALVDESVAHPICLSSSTLLNVPGTIKSITYGGSLMSDPAHTESAILTKDGSIIIANESWETGSDEKENETVKQQVAKIVTSFALLDDNSVSIPSCSIH